MTTEKKNLNWDKIFKLSAVFAAVSVMVFIICISTGSRTAPAAETPAQVESEQFTIMDSFESAISGDLSDAYEAAAGVPRVFWIPEDAEIAPKPNQS